MTVLPKCPSCGLESNEIRCPRCNALKVIGCSGGCVTCGSGKDGACSAPPPADAPKPSDSAREDDPDHPATPLER
jgi:hypothetical protein